MCLVVNRYLLCSRVLNFASLLDSLLDTYLPILEEKLTLVYCTLPLFACLFVCLLSSRDESVSTPRTPYSLLEHASTTSKRG